MQILVDLVKLGAIGASLAFLYLSYQLLKGEQDLKDAAGNPVAPRPELLHATGKFRSAALIFLIVGVFSEFFLSHGTELLNAMNQSLFRKEMVRVRFDTWEYAPENKKIVFSFEENRADTSGYVLPALKDGYDVYVGVRRKDATASGQGQYDLMLGPYPISNQPNLEKILTADELTELGNGCVQFTAFGVLKSNDAAEIPKPFKPAALSNRVSVFNSATACIQ